MRKIKRNKLEKKEKLPRKCSSSRVLIVGCGDIGMRILPLLRKRFSIFALASQPERAAQLRAAGAIPLIGNLDQPRTLTRLARLASHIIYLVPPAQTSGEIIDHRSRHLAAILSHFSYRMVYVSTTGVYGNCDGEFVSETRTVNPSTERAKRRVSAENIWRSWARRTSSCLGIVRVPGIYAANRLPLERLKKSVPALIAEDDVFTNHIHADDLARLVITVLFHGRHNRIYNAVDDSRLLMGDYFDLLADKLDFPRVPRLPRAELAQQVSALTLSFMSESRQIENARIKNELKFRLLYPRVSSAGIQKK